jgi:hypothetical protein
MTKSLSLNVFLTLRDGSQKCVVLPLKVPPSSLLKAFNIVSSDDDDDGGLDDKNVDYSRLSRFAASKCMTAAGCAHMPVRFPGK